MTTNSDFSPAATPTLVTPDENGLSGICTPSGHRFFDNSTLDVGRVCLRKYYFRNIRNWEPAGVRVPLIFGSSVHAALDYIWANAKLIDDPAVLVAGAMKDFDVVWSPKMATREEFDLYPRTPGRAQQVLSCYLDRYLEELRRIEVLEIETPFIVPLAEGSDKLWYIGKWDKVFRNRDGIIILDHKTTNSMASTWQESFSPNGQVSGYLHGGSMTYGAEFDMVMIDGLLIQKTGIDVQRIPCKQQDAQLEAWSWEVVELIETINQHEFWLREYRDGVKAGGPRSSFLPAFPKCTTSCTQYYGKCPYMDLCKYWNNPEDHTCPDGFVESRWTPFNITEKLDGTFQISPREEAE